MIMADAAAAEPDQTSKNDQTSKDAQQSPKLAESEVAQSSAMDLSKSPKLVESEVAQSSDNLPKSPKLVESEVAQSSAMDLSKSPKLVESEVAKSSANLPKDNTVQVANHYNQLQETGLQERTKSRIFYLRNFNNWIKSQCIGETLNKIRRRKGNDANISVLDLGAGKGGDLLKWNKGRISRLVCADIAATSVEQSESRYKEMVERGKNDRRQRLFTAEFVAADCTKQRLKDLYKSPDTEFDLVSCQFAFHYCFESLSQAEMMIRNACECLKPGGYFIGTTPNAHELVKRRDASSDLSFGNDVYRVTFDTKDTPLFGAKYNFHLEGVVDCPEFLVYFPALEKLMEEYNMKLVERKPFAEYFEEQVKTNDGRGLIGRMQALEPYPADDDVELVGSIDEDYKHAHEAAEKQKSKKDESHNDRYRGNKPTKVGTLSQAEWEATTIYCVFAFQKCEVVPAVDTQTSQSQKRTHEGEDNPAEPPSKQVKE